MYYIENQASKLVKYDVKTDSEKLFQIREKIIIKYGKKVHKILETENYQTPYDFKKKTSICDKYINDFSCTKISKEIKIKDDRIVKAQVFKIEYDEYEYPELAKLITKLLNGDYTIISILKNNPIEDVSNAKELELRKELQELARLPIEDKTIQELEKIKEKIYNYNKDNQELIKSKGIREYYKQVLDCITLKEVASISIEKLIDYSNVLKELEKFFGKNVDYNEIEKILKK